MTRIVWISDTHINSPYSLVKPSITLESGGTLSSSEWQKELWKRWIEFWKYAGNVDWLILGGDIIEADDKNRAHVISRDPNDIHDMAISTLEPALDRARRVIVLRGTEAHVGMNAHHEEALAKDITNCVWQRKKAGEDKGVASHWHFVGTLSGSPKLDLAHHAKGSLNPRTRGNPANQMASDIETYYLRRREEPPVYAFRGHVHMVNDSGINFSTRVITAPCWTGSNAYSHRIGQENTPPEIGGIILDVKGKSHEVEVVRYKIEQNHRCKNI